MARVLTYGDVSFVIRGDDVEIRQRSDGSEGRPPVEIAAGALHRLALSHIARPWEPGQRINLSCLLLGEAAEAFTRHPPHPGISMVDKDTVSITVPAGKGPGTVSIAIPLQAVRSLTLEMLRDALIGRIEQLEDEELEAVALAIL